MQFLTEQEWVDKYQPLTNEDGELLWTECRDPDFLARTDIDHRYWWTSKDGEDGVFYENGFGYVDRIQYIECKVPWEGERQTIFVEDDDLRYGDDEEGNDEEL